MISICYDRKRNKKLRKARTTVSLVESIKENEIKWYGHVSRMSKERITRKVLEEKINCESNRRWSRKT